MLLVVSVLLVLVTSFFCSLSEAALLSIGRARVENLAEQSPAGKIIRDMKRSLDRPIAAILILNTVANTGGAAVAGSEYRELFGDGSMVFFGAGLTVAVLLVSEIIPKSIGVRYAERSALLVARPLHAMISALRPLTWLVEQLSRLLGMGGPRPHHVSIDDLRAMARLAASSKVLGREELMIIDAAATLPRVPIRQIMIHRQDIVFFSLAETAEVNMVRARQSLHSRLPVCRQGLESVIGLVNMKEVLWRLADGPEELEEEGLNRILGESMRDPLFAPADIDVSDLIQLFATHHAHLAMVKDETDGIVGMVTLEDVVEELMGEIDDEFDRTPSQIESLGEHRMRIGGGVSWARVRDALGMSGAHEVEEDLDGRLDMNDMAAEKLVGRLRTGAAFVLDGWRFKVTRMRRGKVVLVEASKAARREPRSGAPDPASLGPESGVSS